MKSYNLKNLIGEQWEEIEGYEGRYHVSNLGRVKNLNYKRTGKERIMKQSLVNGYCQICLSKDGKGKTYRVHRLVAQAFIGFIYDGFEVDHIDGSRDNNIVDNLRIVTHEENMNNEITLSRKKCKIINNKKYMDEYEREGQEIFENSYYSADIFYFYRNDYNYPSLPWII